MIEFLEILGIEEMFYYAPAFLTFLILVAFGVARFFSHFTGVVIGAACVVAAQIALTYYLLQTIAALEPLKEMPFWLVFYTTLFGSGTGTYFVAVAIFLALRALNKKTEAPTNKSLAPARKEPSLSKPSEVSRIDGV
ncbi:MAG: hypothetical protein AAFY38_05720 [Pseudomonadota bacterium]